MTITAPEPTIVDVNGAADAPPTTNVVKRDGRTEPVNAQKIVDAVARHTRGLPAVDAHHVAAQTIRGLHDGVSTAELDRHNIQTAAEMIAIDPDYSLLAGRLLAGYIDKEVSGLDIFAFSQSFAAGHRLSLFNDSAADLVRVNARKLNDAVRPERDHLFHYFGLRTLYERYLTRHPETRMVIETPQFFWMRVAVGLSDTAGEAIELYDLLSTLRYVTSSPTLFNSAGSHQQLSSCFLHAGPEDSLAGIYSAVSDVAMLSKFSGGIGISFARVRAAGSLIAGTNGHSNGIVPFAKVLDSSVAAVDQGGRRKGAACLYLPTWHADIDQFLELRDNTGDEARRTYNLNLANWIPDEFMRRVETDSDWSLFDPKAAPELSETYGDEFTAAYLAAEAAGLAARTVRARDLYHRMCRTIAQTGNGWMCFSDASNTKSNQTGRPGNLIRLSNLCTEITEVTSDEETAVCSLGSVNLARVVVDRGDGPEVDYDLIAEVVPVAVRHLDRVIDRNLYQIPQAANSHHQWRPIGLGIMGLQDLFFQLRLPFDSPEALAVSTRVAEEVYYWALRATVDLAAEHGPCERFGDTRAAAGTLNFEMWGVDVADVPSGDPARWEALRADMVTHGTRNSLLVAIAPTATIGTIAGAYECIEPMNSNLFKRVVMGGEFLQVNPYLAADLKARGMWDEPMRRAIQAAEGSVAEVAGLPDDIRELYRTAWELSMRPLIDSAAARAPYIDQAQSMNLFMESPTIDAVSAMYHHVWASGLKTSYYLRSRPATRIRQANTAPAPAPAAGPDGQMNRPVDVIACSLENPESCDACS